MENDLPRLPALGHYSTRWKTAKKTFKATTGKKKPAPTTKTKVFSEKIATIEKRQGTGIDKAIVALEKALPHVFQSEKGQAAYSEAYEDFERKMTEYVKFLETAVLTAPTDVDPQTWKRAVVALKVEVKRIKLELRAYLDRARQSERAKTLAREMAENLFEGLGPMIVVAENWVRERLAEKKINEREFLSGSPVTNARNITQRLLNIHKLPILTDWQSNRKAVPDHIEDTLEDFANGRRTYTNWNEYVTQLNEYRLALVDLEQWLKG